MKAMRLTRTAMFSVVLVAVLGHSKFAAARYLSPEPMLQDPNWVAQQARLGNPAPTYAYARNNPVRWIDATGLDVQNNSNNGVWLVGEQGQQYYLAPGDTYYGLQDGLYTSDGIYKTNNGVHALVNPDGTISTFGPTSSMMPQVYGIGLDGLPYPSYMTDRLGGPKDDAFLKRHRDWPTPPAVNYASGSHCGR